MASLIVLGTHDEMGKRSTAVLRTLNHGQVVSISKAGHACYLDNPRAFNSALFKFILSLITLPQVWLRGELEYDILYCSRYRAHLHVYYWYGFSCFLTFIYIGFFIILFSEWNLSPNYILLFYILFIYGYFIQELYFIYVHYYILYTYIIIFYIINTFL